MTSKKHQKIKQKEYYKNNFFDEEYLVYFTNGKEVFIDVPIRYGDTEKCSHHKAGEIAQKLHPDLDILKICYC